MANGKKKGAPTGAAKVNNQAQGYLNSDQAKQTPFLQGVAKEASDGVLGTARAVDGIISGDRGEIKEGAKQVGKSVLSAVTGGPLRAMNQAPAAQYLGGSPEALNAKRQMFNAGIVGGNDTMGQGLGIVGTAADQSQFDRMNAYGYATGGQQLGVAGIGGQNAALANARAMAGQSTDSLARLQLQQQAEQNQRQMMAMASQARGGNQAAAMRNAQAQGSQMQLQTNQMAAQMRAAEQQAALNRQLGVEQMAAGVGGQQAGLGYGMYGQGLGMAQQSTGQMGSMGLGAANVGLGSQGQFLNASTETDIAQLEADKAQASAAQSAKGGIMGMAGKVIGSVMG